MARACGVCPQQVRNWMHRGQRVAERHLGIIGERLLIPDDEIPAFLLAVGYEPAEIAPLLERARAQGRFAARAGEAA